MWTKTLMFQVLKVILALCVLLCGMKYNFLERIKDLVVCEWHQKGCFHHCLYEKFGGGVSLDDVEKEKGMFSNPRMHSED